MEPERSMKLAKSGAGRRRGEVRSAGRARNGPDCRTGALSSSSARRFAASASSGGRAGALCALAGSFFGPAVVAAIPECAREAAPAAPL